MVAVLPLLHAVDATLSRTSARHGTPPCRVSSKGKGSGTSAAARENFNTGRDPAIGWTSPLPAVRMRAAMFVSAVVATCRGRRRRGAIREDVCWLLTSRTDGVGFSCDRNRPDSLNGTPVVHCSTRTQIIAMRFVRCGQPKASSQGTGFAADYRSDAATARARTVARACEFRTAAESMQMHAVKLRAAHARRRAAAMMHR